MPVFVLVRSLVGFCFLLENALIPHKIPQEPSYYLKLALVVKGDFTLN